jgi:uncharacterized protein
MERNVTLDFVRGVAILGILLLNISALACQGRLSQPAWYGDITRSDAWTWAILDLFAQVKFLTLFACCLAQVCSFCSNAVRAGSSRADAAGDLRFYPRPVLLGRRYSAGYGLVGLICWRLIRDAHSVKSLFNTGVMLYVMGVGVLLLLGMISGEATNVPGSRMPLTSVRTVLEAKAVRKP